MIARDLAPLHLTRLAFHHCERSAGSNLALSLIHANSWQKLSPQSLKNSLKIYFLTLPTSLAENGVIVRFAYWLDKKPGCVLRQIQGGSHASSVCAAARVFVLL